MPKIVDHDLFKRELLEKSIPLSRGGSYAEITMRDIAAQIGVSTGTLYHYFPSKEVMFRELFRHLGKTTIQEVVADLCDITGPEEKLVRLFDFFEKRCEKMRQQFLLSADLLRHDFGETGEEILQEWASYLARSLKALLSLPEPYAGLVFTFLSGSLYAGFVRHEQKQQKAEFRVFREMLLRQLENDPAWHGRRDKKHERGQ